MAKNKQPLRGWWVKPTDEVKKKIQERCKESMREPGVEISFILRDYFREQDRQEEESDRKEREMNERLDTVEEEH